MVFVFYYAATHSLEMTKWGMFFAGVFTVGQLSFWGNYLPRVFPTHLRGTGEGFAANIGGRMIGTSFAFVTTQLVNIVPGATPPARLALAATMVAAFVYTGGHYLAASSCRNPRAIRFRSSAHDTECLTCLRCAGQRASTALLRAMSRATVAVQRSRVEGWPQFRGPGSTGVAEGTNLPETLEHHREREVEDGHSRSWVVVADCVARSRLRHVGDPGRRDRGAEKGLVLRRRAAGAEGRAPVDGLRHRLEHRKDRSGSARRIAAYRRHRAT